MTHTVSHDPDKIYVVFSATPGKLGRTIRKVMGGVYNHVSISFSPELTPLYSFARIHENTPLYGGFVEESPLRYVRNGRNSQIKLCEIPLTRRQSMLICRELSHIRHSDRRQIYNTFSAAVAPLHRNLSISDSYTCVEFAAKILRNIEQLALPDSFLSVTDMEERLAPFVIYEGSILPFCRSASWGEDKFPIKQKKRVYAAETAKNLSALTVRRITDRRKKSSKK
ncbi:MAG: hypothetical protein IJF27_01030 [Oscillospiraceae bacterium]|nr:hypothetical protein [Oscillospiraceae bacterium]